MSPDAPHRLRAAALASLDLSIAPRSAEVDAHDVWRALLQGRCCLIESFDADGHRYLIARRTPGVPRSNTRLTPLEARALCLRAQGDSYKVIASELGMSTAAAHGLTQSGMRKIGVRDEAELPWLLRRPSASPRVGRTPP